MGYLTFIKYMTCTRWTTLSMNSFDRLFMDRPVEPPLGSALRERLRTHKVFTKDQCFYLNYRKFSIKSYVLDVY